MTTTTFVNYTTAARGGEGRMCNRWRLQLDQNMNVTRQQNEPAINKAEPTPSLLILAQERARTFQLGY